MGFIKQVVKVLKEGYGEGDKRIPWYETESGIEYLKLCKWRMDNPEEAKKEFTFKKWREIKEQRKKQEVKK